MPRPNAFARLLVLVPTLGLAGSAAAQAPEVFFLNNGLTFPTTADRLVRDVDGGLLVGAQYLVQLFYVLDAGVPIDVDQMNVVDAGPSRFRASTTAYPGTWLTPPGGASRRLEGAALGGTVTLVVKAWDCAGTKVGTSAPFSYLVPATPLNPQAYYMDNLRGFSLQNDSDGGLAAAYAPFCDAGT